MEVSLSLVRRYITGKQIQKLGGISFPQTPLIPNSSTYALSHGSSRSVTNINNRGCSEWTEPRQTNDQEPTCCDSEKKKNARDHLEQPWKLRLRESRLPVSVTHGSVSGRGRTRTQIWSFAPRHHHHTQHCSHTFEHFARTVCFFSGDSFRE